MLQFASVSMGGFVKEACFIFGETFKTQNVILINGREYGSGLCVIFCSDNIIVISHARLLQLSMPQKNYAPQKCLPTSLAGFTKLETCVINKFHVTDITGNIHANICTGVSPNSSHRK